MATIKLNKASIDAIRNFADISVKASNSLALAAEALKKQNVTAEMLFSPKKGEDRTLYNSACEAVVLGFAPEVQELLQKKPATLTEAEKADRRYWQQQIGSKLKDIRNKLKPKEGNGASNQRTPLQIIQDRITDAIERMGNLDPENGDAIPDAMDIPTATKKLKEGLAAFLGK